MIDELWLRDLRVSGPEGDIVGLLGVGAEWVVFETLKPGGERTALSFYKNLLGFHIREVSYFLTDKPGYDLDRLNRKLRRLMSAPSVDSMIGPYDRLYSKIISELAAGGPQNLMSQARKKMGWSAAEAIPFMLSTKGVKRRIDEIASLDSGDVDEREIVTVNGPSFPMTADRSKLASWGKMMRDFLTEFTELLSAQGIPDPAIKPDRLEANPLYVWGGAAIDGFFTDGEFTQVAEYINGEFGKLPVSDAVVTYSQQAMFLSHLLALYMDESRFVRLVKLAAVLGLDFPVTDQEGRTTLYGSSLLSRRTDEPSLHAVMLGKVITPRPGG
jgi:hypothetical protein